MISQFYLVSVHIKNSKRVSASAYEVYMVDPTRVVVIKIAGKGESEIPVDGQIDNGYTVAIQYSGGLQRYNEARGGRRVDEVNSFHHGGHTSSIAGLFSKQTDAMICFETPDLNEWDERFIDSSIKIIEAIGSNPGSIINLDGTLARGLKEGKLRQYLLQNNLAYTE